MQDGHRVVLALGAVALVAAGAWLFFGPDAGPARGPLSSRAEGGTSGAPETRPAPPTPDRAQPEDDPDARAARLALDAVGQALGLLSRGGHDDLSRREALDLALDPEAPGVDRVRALRLLGRLGDDEALDVIERVLRGETNPDLLYNAALALGDARRPTAARLLAELIDAENGPVRLGAIAALGARAQPEDVVRLRALLRGESESPAARQAAAAALVGLGGEEVVADLAHVLRHERDPSIVHAALESLAARSWQDSEDTIRGLLALPDLEPEREVELLEALSASSPGAVPLLVEYAGDASRPEARRAAVESLAMIEGAEDLGDRLYALSVEETDPGVRSELYQAMALHSDWELGEQAQAALVGRVATETDPGLRLQGSRMLAARLRSSGDPELARTFDEELLPWLAGRAGDPGVSRYERLTQIDALKLAGTAAARDALETLARGLDPAIAEPARKALEFPGLP